jgi:CRP/FNR family transcriptional regulator, anaerobic regulatory protein
MLQVVHSAQITPRGTVAAKAVPQALAMPHRDRVAALMARRHLRPKETAFYEDDTADALFEVVEGVLKLYKLLPDGRRQITGFAFPGQWVGIGLCDAYAYTAEAVTEVTLARYPRTRLENLYDEVPGLARRILSLAAAELAAAQDQMLLLGRKSVMEKVASFLLRLAEQAEERGDDPDDLRLPMSRTDIGDYLGLTIETTCRVLSQLCRMGIIETGRRNRIRLRDPDQLADLAEGDVLSSAALV